MLGTVARQGASRTGRDFPGAPDHGAFVNIRDALVRQEVDRDLGEGRLWPEPWLSLNPKFEPVGTIGDLLSDGVLHPECDRIFRLRTDAKLGGQELNLYRHQASARPNAALACASACRRLRSAAVRSACGCLAASLSRVQ